jgi:hypothetical protein
MGMAVGEKGVAGWLRDEEMGIGKSDRSKGSWSAIHPLRHGERHLANQFLPVHRAGVTRIHRESDQVAGAVLRSIIDAGQVEGIVADQA